MLKFSDAFALLYIIFIPFPPSCNNLSSLEVSITIDTPISVEKILRYHMNITFTNSGATGMLRSARSLNHIPELY